MKQAVVAVGFCVGLGTILGLQAIFVRENPDLEEAAHVIMVIHFRVPTRRLLWVGQMGGEEKGAPMMAQACSARKLFYCQCTVGNFFYGCSVLSIPPCLPSDGIPRRLLCYIIFELPATYVPGWLRTKAGMVL